MTWEHLKYFIEVCESGSIQAAAKKIFVSAQGIGQGIQRLEKSTGVRLLERTSNGAYPTEFGKIFFEQALKADSELQKLQNLVEDYRKQMRTRITIGILGRTKYLSSISSCVADYLKIHPDASLEVSAQTFSKSEDLLAAVRKGEVDVGWMFHWKDRPEFRYYHVSEYSNLVLLVSRENPLAKNESITWADFGKQRVVLPSEEDPFSDVLLKICADHNCAPSEIFYCSETNLIANLIDNNIASIILREEYCAAVFHSCKNAVEIPIEPEARLASSLFVSGERSTKGEINSFLAYMVGYLRDIMGIHRKS